MVVARRKEGANNKKLPCQMTTSTYFIYSHLKRERRR